MGQFLEIIFFALLSAYLFYRLWSVLGKETDEDKERRDRLYRSEVEGEADNVIPLHQRSQPQQQPVETLEDTLTHGVRDGIRQIKQVEPDFDLEMFMNGAKAAYEIIVDAFASGDKETLKSLLTEKVYTQFAKAIDERDRQGMVHHTVIERLDLCDVDSIEIAPPMILVTIRYRSRQIMTTKNVDGQIVDNPAEISIPVTDIWTFTREIGSEDQSWFLAATSSGSYRD